MSPRYLSEDADPTSLGQPLHFTFSARTAPNRFLKAAMTERLSSWHPTDLCARGIPSTNYINLYRRWGEGQIGLMLSGNIQIEYEHLEAAGNAIIPREAKFDGERFERFREAATEGKKNESLFMGQVSHPGRQVPDTIQAHPISASNIELTGKLDSIHPPFLVTIRPFADPSNA